MSDIILNNKQAQACKEAERWFKYSSDKVFQLAGYAGTGKTTTINAIIEKLGLKKHEILPMAYTGQAAIVMRMHGFITASTCLSALYNHVLVPKLNSKGKPIMNTKTNTKILEWKHMLKPISDFEEIKLIVIDEAYMVPANLRKDIERLGIKILAAGDPGQLPPVKYLPGFFNDDSPIFLLDEIMRQQSGSAILYLAERARKSLPIEPGFYGNALVISQDELNLNIISNSDIVICGSNEMRDNINNTVRNEVLKTSSDLPLYGERIICRKNNWECNIGDFSLVNGMVGSVSVPSSPGDYDGKTFGVFFRPDIINQDVYLRLNHEYINSPANKRQELHNNMFIQGELFEYAYALTLYGAQGSEYSKGTYIEQSYTCKDPAYAYTAITRFRDKMIYVLDLKKYWAGYDW